MNVIAIDDEKLALEELMETIRRVRPQATLTGFRSTAEALLYARGHRVDVAFLDIRMRDMNGLMLAKELKDINGSVNIIFVTGYADYAVDAFALHASGFLLKPASAKDVEDAFAHLRTPVLTCPPNVLQIQTFGNFEVFMNGMPVRFERSKAKEVLAYLVHKRGSSCTIRELCAVLFEDGGAEHQRQMQTYLSSLKKTLKAVGAEDVLLKTYNSIAIDPGKVDCDYYRFLKWDPDAVNHYTGEYMANYSWGEFVTGYLDSHVL